MVDSASLARRSRPVASGRRLQPVVGCGIVQRWKKPRWLGGLLGPDRGGWAAWAGRQAKAGEVAVTRQPKRKGGEMGQNRVATKRLGRMERAGLEGKEVRRLLGWVEVAWAGWAELGNE
jgi:hypothetical protein